MRREAGSYLNDLSLSYRFCIHTQISLEFDHILLIEISQDVMMAVKLLGSVHHLFPHIVPLKH